MIKPNQISNSTESIQENVHKNKKWLAKARINAKKRLTPKMFELYCDYSDEFKKGFRDIIPVSDLADLLLYVVHLKKVKNIELDGLDFLLEYQEEGIEEVDQFSFTNTLLYIQKSKEVEIEF